MNLDQVKRIATNALLFGVAAFSAAIVASEGDITLSVVIAAVAIGGRAALATAAKALGLVTPGKAVIVNALVDGAGAFFSALAAGGDFTIAGVTAAGYAAARAAFGELTTVADNPKSTVDVPQRE